MAAWRTGFFFLLETRVEVFEEVFEFPDEFLLSLTCATVTVKVEHREIELVKSEGNRQGRKQVVALDACVKLSVLISRTEKLKKHGEGICVLQPEFVSHLLLFLSQTCQDVIYS